MTFQETPPEKQDEIELGPTGTDALEYRIEKLLRIEEAARDVVSAHESIAEHCQKLANGSVDHDSGEELLADRIVAIEELRDSLTEKLSPPRDILRSAIKLAMGPDPHSGLDPHPDTIDAITDGVLARIAVNNARPAKYANEPWREQSAGYHADHARVHMDTAWAGVNFRAVWLSDLNQPEAAHAGLRIDFLLFRHAKDEVGK